MKKVIISSAVIAIAILIFTSVIYSQPSPGNGPSIGRHNKEFINNSNRMDIIADKLNLTDIQKDKIKSLQVDHRKKMIDLRADLQKARVDAKEVRNNNNISRADAVKAAELINKLENEISLSRVNHRMDIYEILTPEQKKIWKDLRDDMPGHKMWSKNGKRGRCNNF
jgi:Spy/CpxP family protein refolding chaperone